MKKIVFISMLFMLTTTTASAQAALFALIFGDKVASEKFNISLEIGGIFPGYTNLDSNSIMGINFGIGGNLKLSKNWYLRPNIYFLANRNLELDAFSLNSSNSTLNSQFEDVPTKIKMNYIDVPIFISYRTNDEKYQFSLAPQISFRQSAEGTFENNEGEFSNSLSTLTSKTDYGLMADIGYIWGNAFKGKSVHVSLRYYYGFTDVLDNEISTADNRSNYLSLHLSFPFISDDTPKPDSE